MSRPDPADGRERGTCPVCGRGPFLITKAGKVRHHSSGGPEWPPQNCDGSGQPPAQTGETRT